MADQGFPPDGARPGTLARLERVRGRAVVGFACREGRTRLADLEQSGSAKIRLPKTHDGPPVAVLLNTAGGLTGGDRLETEARLGAGGHAVVTTQAAERIYRSAEGAAQVDSAVRVEAGATLEWLPQETILFDRASLTRSLAADLAGDARLIALESVVLGRAAMGETVHALQFRDRWRIRRDGRLVFADEARISGDAADILAGSATAAGGRAFATLVDCFPQASEALARARTLVEDIRAPELRVGVSALPDLLVMRFVAEEGTALRTGVERFLTAWRDAPLPRTWNC
ncbi:urease accessory protein UreD [Stappia sp.]|uniref:urease accessory protein UreD n=1 Tax=Stappia sp. TaxID=1870903 RepID=UPI0032D903C5